MLCCNILSNRRLMLQYYLWFYLAWDWLSVGFEWMGWEEKNLGHYDFLYRMSRPNRVDIISGVVPFPLSINAGKKGTTPEIMST